MTSETDQVKETQDIINAQHPFGIKLWKPALYRKNRSIDAKTWLALHSMSKSH
jgi:Ca2+:H+ antiporter